MVKQKRKSKVKKARAAKKKATVVRRLKPRHAKKAAPARKPLRAKVAASAKKPVKPVAVTAKGGGKPEAQKLPVGKQIKTTAKQALELLEAKVAQVKTKGKRGRRGGKDAWHIPAELPKEDAETRRTRLKNLINLGKERGFLKIGRASCR